MHVLLTVPGPDCSSDNIISMVLSQASNAISCQNSECLRCNCPDTEQPGRMRENQGKLWR